VFVNFLSLQYKCCSTGGSFSFCIPLIRFLSFQNFQIITPRIQILTPNFDATRATDTV